MIMKHYHVKPSAKNKCARILISGTHDDNEALSYKTLGHSSCLSISTPCRMHAVKKPVTSTSMNYITALEYALLTIVITRMCTAPHTSNLQFGKPADKSCTHGMIDEESAKLSSIEVKIVTESHSISGNCHF